MIQALRFFQPKAQFEEGETILRQQIFGLLIISFFFGSGVLIFSWFRLHEGNLLVGASQLLLGLFMLYGFYRLRRDKAYYRYYSIAFMILFFAYTTLIFFFVPQNHLNILWVISAPILIFFFLDRKGGVVMFVWVLIFICCLMVTGYPYSIAEFVTLLAAFLITSFVMYIYERVKEGERERLLRYSAALQEKVSKKTSALQALNRELEKRVEEEVGKRLAQEQMLLRQSRMASMGEMVDAIAHQWRQPLMNINAVMLNLDQGIASAQDSAPLRQKIRDVFMLTAHMSHTIEDFRNLLREEKSQQHFNLHEVVEKILTLMKNNLRHIDLVCEIDEEIVLHGCRSEFSQVLIILLGNAAEALHTRGIDTKRITIGARYVERWLHLSVEDNAGGIAEADISRIFDPYFTTKVQTGGTGLGLYIAQIIIEHNMHGMLRAENGTDGAIFKISLPR